MILYHRNYGRTWNSEITKNEEDSCLDSIICRVVVIHTSPTQFIWKKSIQNRRSSTLHSFFLILTDHGNVVSKVPSLGHSWTQASHRAQKKYKKKMLIMLMEVLQFCMFRF